MGTATVAIKKRTGITAVGQSTVVDITLSTSYATGGDTVTLASLGLPSVSAMVLTSNAGGYNVQVVHGAVETTAPLLKVYQGDNTNAAAAPGIEVPNTTNLSTVVVRAIVYSDPFV